MSRNRCLGRGSVDRQRECTTCRTSYTASFIAAGPSLPATAGPSTSLTGPSNSSTGMDPFGGVWVRQQPSGTCFSYSKTHGPAPLFLKVLPSNSSPSFSLIKFLICLWRRPIAMLPQFAELVAHACSWTDMTV